MIGNLPREDPRFSGWMYRQSASLLRPFGLAASLLLSLSGCGPKQTNVIHQERSLYSNIYVTEEGGQRCMRFRVRMNTLAQGCVLRDDINRHALEYSKLVMVGAYAVPAPRRVLVLGLGVGVIPRTLQSLFPDAQIDIAEIDPAVVKIARTYFAYEPSPGVRVIVDDGRRFVRSQLRANKTYDLVVLDAFNGDYIPEHLMTSEFLQEVKSVIAPGGAVAANTFAGSKLFHSESQTYNSVFGGFVSINRLNRIILTTPQGPPALDMLSRNAAMLDHRLRRFGLRKEALLPLINSRPRWDRTAPILTDSYSPANLLNQ